MSQNLHLDGDAITQTAQRLELRIRERFPDSGLANIAKDLTSLSRSTLELSRKLSRPWWWVRVACGLGILAVLGAVIGVALNLDLDVSVGAFTEVVQALESGVNDAVFIGIATWFLLSVESRLKRNHALHSLHRLRAIAHIIDMHQLAKDPERTVDPSLGTRSSPTHQMTPFLLTRYLDYCAEMLALVGKLSALVVQDNADPVVLGAVNDLENLTSGLSRKVWQKIDIVERITGPVGVGRAAPPRAG